MTAAATAAPAPTTLAIRVCSGAFLPGCLRVYATESWPWSGAAIVTSHGLCTDCFRREQAALDALEEDDARITAAPRTGAL